MGPMLQREPSGLPSFAIKVNNKIFKIFKQSLQSSSKRNHINGPALHMAGAKNDF